MGPMIQQHGMRRLDEMRAQTDLVAHRPGRTPQRGLLAGDLRKAVLQRVDGGVAGFVVHVVLHGGVYDCLRRTVVSSTAGGCWHKPNEHTCIIDSVGTVTTSERKSCATACCAFRRRFVEVYRNVGSGGFVLVEAGR